MRFHKPFTYFVLIIAFFITENVAFSIEDNVQTTKYPDYSFLYVGYDKYENYNRKMFNFNLKLNKRVIRPIHIIWTSIVPKGVVDHVQIAYNNIEYPKRLVSTMVQKDFKHSRSETKRFFINLTMGLGGLFDPANSVFKIKGVNEDMGQALTHCNMKSGHYLILPVITPTNTRNITGSILDTALNPSSYLFFSGFLVTAIKAGITINRTSRFQPIAAMLSSNYADPYDMAKKIYGLEKYILIENYDRKEVLEEAQNLRLQNQCYGFVNVGYKQNSMIPNISLENYNPQGPVTDSLRTALFNDKSVYKSCWSDTSVWNKSFNKKIKTGKVTVFKDRPAYQYRYILQKDKNAPIAIMYPSIGEGRTSSHSVFFGKMFYDRGYSVLIMGSQFQWEFKRSMPEDYKPGFPINDVKYLRETTSAILNQLEEKHHKNFRENVIVGTSLGALMTLEVANAESEENTLNVAKYIAISPPIDLIYAMKQFDNNSEEWVKFSDNLKDNVALTAAKVTNIFMGEAITEENMNDLKFSEDEAKLITGYIMHQKLSDLIYEIENSKYTDKNELYKQINNMNYQDYMNKYLATNNKTLINNEKEASIFYIKDYLKNNNNYIIYHSLDDYLDDPKEMKELKHYAGKRMVLLSNGAHLGFMYRPEFKDNLIKEIPVVNSKK